MGYIDMDTIIMDKSDYDYWKNNGNDFSIFFAV